MIEESNRTLLKDVAYERLKQLIVEGTFAPGRFLSERLLAESFGMSKSPVRSAIERLSAEGYLIVSPQQGIVVAEISMSEIMDHFELRIAVECYVVKSLAGRLDERVEAALRRNLDEQHESSGRDDLPSYRKLDSEYHMLLADGLGNREISRVMARQSDKLARVITRVLGQRSSRMLDSWKEHTHILDAIVAGDGERAARLMQEHLRWGERFLLSG